MNRYEILTGKKPPKENPNQGPKRPEFVRRFFLGNRREGKTTALVSEMLRMLSAPTIHICYCSHNMDAATDVVRNLKASMRNMAMVHQYYPDFERRVHPGSFRNLPVSALHGGVTGLFLDNIDCYVERREEGIPVFHTLGIINQYPVPTVMAACDRNDFQASVEICINRDMHSWGGFHGRHFVYQGIPWELWDVGARRRARTYEEFSRLR